MDLPVYSLQPHFVGKRLFAGQNGGALQIAFHHKNNGLVPGKLLDFRFHGGQARQFTGFCPTVAGDDFVPPIRLLPQRHRSDDPPLFDTLYQLIHVLVYAYMKGMIRKFINFRKGNFMDFGELGFRSLPIIHEQLI